MEGDFRLSLTGTPGTGKSTLAGLLSTNELNIITIEELAEKAGALEELDRFDGAHPVDLDILLEYLNQNWQLPPTGPEVIDGHFSHNLPVDAVVVLRCNPDILRDRLKQRGYSDSKIESNVEWELLGGAWNEKEDDTPWIEFDTTDIEPEFIVENILKWISDGFKPTSPEDVIDWVG